MLFEVLGPMRVTDRHGTRPVTGMRQRILLGALLAHPNQPLAAGRLAELVWDGAPPAGAAATIRTYLARLRHDLGPDAASRILTRDGGYLAAIGPSELDALAFEALCREAGGAIRAADWRSASDHAGRALALWGPTPLSDVPSQALRNLWLPRLEQQHLQVCEWRVEAELQLGRHEHMIAQLRQLVAEHPLYEPFHVQLMLALARCGQQAEALAVYRDARTVLVEELGLDPGRALKQLHQQILSGDRNPAPSQTPADRAPPATVLTAAPRRLPAAARNFTGRDRELDVLVGLASSPVEPDDSGATVVICAVDGMAGIGKSALAVHAAHRVADRFPNGQLFIDLHGHTRGHPPRESGQALEMLLRALGVPAGQIPEDAEECAALYRQRLAGTRTLILLDNARDEAQVRPLLPGLPGCLVLITSRRRLKGLDDAHSLALDLLPEPDATALLRAVSGPDRIAADDPLLAEIAGLCGYLPLALRIAGALLRHRPARNPEHLADLLRDRHHRMAALSDGERDLNAVFDLSYTGQDEQRRLLFRLLGLVPGPDVDAYAAAALLGCDLRVAAGMLEDLVDHNLLIAHASARYRLHDLIRAHAQALAAADPEHERDAAVDRLLHYYEHTAQSASVQIARYPRPAPQDPAPAHAPVLSVSEDARSWLRAERENIEAAYLHARARNLDAHVLALTAGLAALLSTDGPFARAHDLHQGAVETAERHGDLPAQATALTDLGILQRLAGDVTGATVSLSRAREIARTTGRRDNEATALTELSIVLRLAGDQPAAGETVRQALDLYRAIGHRRGEATALLDLGIVCYLTRDLTGAAESLTEALEIFRQVGFQQGEADALAELGVVARLNGDPAAAIDHSTQALEIYSALGHRHGEATTLARLGSAQQLNGDQAAAGESFARALELYRALGQRSGEAYVLTELGVAQLQSGNASEAAESQAQALEIFRENNHRNNEATAIIRYADATAATGDAPRALALYQQAVDINRELNYPDGEAVALEGAGECLLAAGDTDQGAAHLRRALSAFQQLDMRVDAERVASRLTALAAA